MRPAQRLQFRAIALALTALCLAATPAPQITQLPFDSTIADVANLAPVMPALAKAADPSTRDPDQLFRLQIVAGEYDAALATLKKLNGGVALDNYVIYASAESNGATSKAAFPDALRQAFNETFATLDDKDAVTVSNALAVTADTTKLDLQNAFDNVKGKSAITPADASELVAKYLDYTMAVEMAPSEERLQRSDAERRYIIQDQILVKDRDGATNSVMVVRKRGITTRQPASLIFTIYANPPSDLRRLEYAAARGYVAVIGYTRGKALSPNTIVPYEDDGRDADSVIEWIAKQPWSNGKVGMYGGSYEGFTQWAAAKHPPKALKTIVPYVANNPGNGLPMENNVFIFANYAWAFYVTDNKYLDNDTYYNPARWRSLNGKWYASGRRYRDVDKIDGTPNPLFQRWLRHPNYDAYWQAMLPYQSEFSRINIPVLTFTGYYDDGQGSALNFFKDHIKYNNNSVDYLVIGPYDHFGSQRSHKPEVLRGYAIDPAAQIDTPAITFEWLDYILRGGKKPALLQDRVNYEVMGGNLWKHAPSIAKMADRRLTLYLTPNKTADGYYEFATQRPKRVQNLAQTVDLADRKTANNDSYPFPIADKKPNLSNGYTFATAPFDQPVDLSGCFDGEFNVIINKRDFDIGLALYELTPDGKLFELSYFTGRASYARDISKRTLLTPGAIATIPFDRSRLVSKRLGKGSRLLLTVNVNKNPFAQINYGTGKDVSDESIADAKAPLKIQWLTTSYIRVPLARP